MRLIKLIERRKKLHKRGVAIVVEQNISISPKEVYNSAIKGAKLVGRLDELERLIKIKAKKVLIKNGWRKSGKYFAHNDYGIHDINTAIIVHLDSKKDKV